MDNFNVRNSAKTFDDLRILESLLINHRPSLNLASSSYPLEIVNQADSFSIYFLIPISPF